jgi:hypothetical protein
MPRRRQSSAVLYWRFVRPRARIYATSSAQFIGYRVVAAGGAIIAFALAAFDGAMVGAVGYPRWPPLNKVNAHVALEAIVQASSFASRLAPVILALGIVLAVMPRAHRWHFRIGLLCVIALGYFETSLPQLSQTKLSAEISSHVALAAHSVLSKQTGNSPLYLLGVLTVVIAAFMYTFYLNYYSVAFRTLELIPHRPRNHRRSSFLAVSMARRLIAAIVTAVLLAISLWLMDSGRTLVSVTRHAGPGPWHARFTLIEWVLIALVAGLIVCGSRPNGSRWLLVVLLTVVTVGAFWPYNLFPLPAGIPTAPHSFWPLVIAYIAVTGMAFDLVTALLDWPL